MTTTIQMVRHGQTEANITGFCSGRSGIDLNETGYQQVRRLAARLAKTPITALYTSPLLRTRNTAAIIAEPHRLKLTELEEFIEIDLGDWTGKYFSEIGQEWPVLWQQWVTDPLEVTVPNGENLARITERALKGLEKVAAAHRDNDVLVVTHDIIIKVLVIHTLDTTNRIYRHFDISNASLSTIRYQKNRPRLVTLNDTAHLID